MEQLLQQYQSIGISGVTIIFVWRFGKWLLPNIDKIIGKYVTTQETLNNVLIEMNVVLKSVDVRLAIIERELLQKENPP